MKKDYKCQLSMLSQAYDLGREKAFDLLKSEVEELENAESQCDILEELNDVYYALYNLSRALSGDNYDFDKKRILEKVGKRLKKYGTISKRNKHVQDEPQINQVEFDVIHFAFGSFRQPWQKFDPFKNGTEAEIATITSEIKLSGDRSGNHLIACFDSVENIEIKFLTTSWDVSDGNTALLRIPDWLFNFCKSKNLLEEFEEYLFNQVAAGIGAIRLCQTPIFHFHSWECGFLTNGLFNYYGTKFFSPYLTLSRLRNLMIREGDSGWTISREVCEIGAKYEERLVKFVDKTVVESDKDFEHYKDLVPSSNIIKNIFLKKKVAHLKSNGILEKKTCRIISGGRAVKEKGFDLLIKSVNKIESVLNVNLSIDIYCLENSRTDGKRKYINFVDHLNKVIKDESASDRIFLHEKISIELLKEKIKESDVMIIPSRYDPFCLMPMYGWEVGVPVLVSKYTGISEIIPDKSYIFDPYDNEETADKLKLIMSRKEDSVNLDYEATLAALYSLDLK